MLTGSVTWWVGWWCEAEWPLDGKGDVGGISCDSRMMAAGEDLRRDLL